MIDISHHVILGAYFSRGFSETAHFIGSRDIGSAVITTEEDANKTQNKTHETETHSLKQLDLRIAIYNSLRGGVSEIEDTRDPYHPPLTPLLILLVEHLLHPESEKCCRRQRCPPAGAKHTEGLE